MAFSKIILNGTTLMDLTADTVDSATAVQGETGHNAAGESFVGNYQGSTINNQNKSVSPTESQQQVTADSGYTGLGTVTVGAISSTYVGSGVATHTSGDLTVSGAIVTAPAGYYGASASKSVATMTLPTSAAATASSGYSSKATISRSTSDQYINIPTGYNTSGAYYKINAVANGTEGTPTATKGTVSNHSVSITPSVTNTAGYITGGAKTGTAVTVSASELVSGNLAITENGTNIDVTNYSTVSVAVEGGGSGPQMATAERTGGSGYTAIFTGLLGEPTSFIAVCDENITPSAQSMIETVVYDGTNIHAQAITNTSNANVSYVNSGVSYTYSNGTLTITSSSVQFDEVAYVLHYSYGGSSANIDTKDVQVGSGATSITFTGLDDEPMAWYCTFKSNFGTSSGYQRVIYVANTTHVFGAEMDSAARNALHWTASYNNGSLTITSQGTNAGGYFHQPGYYQLTAVYGEASPYQKKTVTPTTSTQIVVPDTGYDALSQVTVNPIPDEYIIPTGNYPITTNGNNINIAQYATVSVNVSGGGANIATVTTTNSSNQNTSIDFTLPSGRTPKAFFARLTSQIARSSNSRYYYVFDMRWNGSSTGGVAGNTFYMYNGTLTNVTSGYSYSQSNTTFTLSSTGSRSASPGSFYNGTYELVYVY